MRHWDVALFDLDVPDGFRYRDDFISAEEEASLAGEIARIEFDTFEMRGVVARRRVAFFGRSYDGARARVLPMPEFLLPLRERIADWAGVAGADFAMALINEYAPGAPIGWHRDAPPYGIVAGVSLLSSSRMKLRPHVAPAAHASRQGKKRTATHTIELARRSAYLMAGESRSGYEHHIPPVTELRYSITFRTLRAA
jgi:alkylated DNA repair dioxygenase AlkB